MILKLPDIKGAELHKYLYENKALLTAQKKVGPHSAGAVSFAYSPKADSTDKALKMPEMQDGALVVEVIANLTGWMDFDNDVCIAGAYSKTVADGGYKPFLKNHDYDTDSIIAETLAVYIKDFSPFELGIQGSATVNPQGLIFKARLVEDVAGKIYHQYKNSLIKQHSIGLRYIRLKLCLNDPQFEAEYKDWQTYYPQVLNKQKADEEGYFWALLEIQVVECSAVVFGSNSQTRVISIVEEPPTVQDMGEEKAMAVIDTNAKKQKSISHYNLF
jgi:hypothetical protein